MNLLILLYVCYDLALVCFLETFRVLLPRKNIRAGPQIYVDLKQRFACMHELPQGLHTAFDT